MNRSCICWCHEWTI